MSDFEKREEELLSKEMLYGSLTGKSVMIKNIIMFLRFGIHFKQNR